MLKKNYLLNSDEQIIKLKSELMTSENNTTVSFSSEYFKNRNSEIGKLLEENIKKSLEYECGWEKGDLDDHFYYRIVTLGRKQNIIMRDGKLNINTNKINYTLVSNSDTIKLLKGKSLLSKWNNDKNKDYSSMINAKNLVISKEKEIETDGYYHVQNFDYSIFLKDFTVIYNNLEEEDTNEACNILVEIKLNKKKLPELINQLKEDINVFETMTEEKIICVGFVGKSGKKSNNDLNIEEEVQGLKCIIFEMKSPYFFNRNMRNPLDWKLIKDVKQNTEDIKIIKEDINKLQTSVSGLRTSVAGLQTSVSEIKDGVDMIKKFLLSHYQNGIKILGQKRPRRGQKDN